MAVGEAWEVPTGEERPPKEPPALSLSDSLKAIFRPGQKQRYFATVPPQEILPITGSDYQSSVKGVYVIGDVTGLPLVKVAANQGVEVIEAMERKGDLKPKQRDGGDRLDLVIIGGGPGGLSAAYEARQRGARYVLLERSVLANTIYSFPPGKRVYSEPRYLKNKSAIPAEGDRERDDFLAAVRQLVESEEINVEEGCDVERVEKRAGGFEVVTGDGRTFTARRVVVAVGRQGEPRTLGVPGEDLKKTTHRFHTADDYHGQNIFVVGGGNSAVEAALMLADHNDVTLSYRREDFFRLKPNNDQAIREAMDEGRLEVIFNSNVVEIRQDQVDIEVQGEARTLENDCTIIQAGTLPPVDFLMDMGLKLDGIWTKKRVMWSIVGIALGVFAYFYASYFYLYPERAGEDDFVIPGFAWLYEVLPPYFAHLGAIYFLLYFTGVLVFGVYWAVRYNNRIVWRRNLLNIVFNWTLWWGIPTFLVAFGGRNVWTGVLPKTLNAWPLNYAAFNVTPQLQAGDPAWWQMVAVAGVLWTVILTFTVIPLFTVFVGKHYCSHLCSCGALAETVGNSFRHKGPKGDRSRWLERFGFVFIPLCAVATIASLLGWQGPMALYGVWVGTLLAGALAIGLYPFLGQRIWCRYWCPLAFWMNFWGRWSRFKISPEKGKCIDCNVCNQFCQMGIDIKSRALKGVPVTLKDTPCVACGECIARCPMEILHFGEAPANKPYPQGTDAGPGKTREDRLRGTTDIPKYNEACLRERQRVERTTDEA
jgi:putative YpdA family bacillithiol system oxidoreductase